jgi:hypothetical protein
MPILGLACDAPLTTGGPRPYRGFAATHPAKLRRIACTSSVSGASAMTWSIAAASASLPE